MFKRPIAVVSGSKRLAARDLPPDGPQVCLIYESEEERGELSRRLREAGLDSVPWQFVNLGSEERLSPYLGALRRSPRRLIDILGAGSVAAATMLGSNWPLVAAVILAGAPLLVVLWLFRGLGPSKVAAAG